MISEERIQIFQNLFKGREDIFARRWEREGKSGYMPAYDVDWNEYERFKAQGGQFKDFQNKKHLPFTKSAIVEHLTGKYTVGIYPLLSDNTSYFIVADFDKENWLKESVSFVHTCNRYEIPAYVERSRSGNGGHVWIFFEDKYPAYKSRKTIFELLRESLNVSPFDKEISFDRLFPNQDYHTKQGFGNLIALPLNGKSLDKGNSAFIDCSCFSPYQDQWLFLSDVKRLPVTHLDKLFETFSENNIEKASSTIPIISSKSELQINIKNQIILNKIQLTPQLIQFIRDNLNFINSEYLIKKNLGKSLYKTEKYFKLIEETKNEIFIPRGFAAKLIDFCKENSIAFKIVDQRKKSEPINIPSKIELYDYQETALEIAANKDFGVIVAPSGSGKTIIGLELLSRKQQPALILVHRKQLLDQWIERIQSFLGIPKKDIGKIAGGKFTIGEQITVGMLQSLAKLKTVEELRNSFGMIIVDECHHIPAKTFREIITKFNSYYLYGLTATPKRKNNDEKLIFVFIGEIISEIKPGGIDNKAPERHSISLNIRDTGLAVPFDYRIDKYETVSKILVFDTSRNLMIVNDIISQVNEHRKVLVLTERKEHINVLNLYLKEKYETITISGDDSEISRKSKLAQIKTGYFQIVLSTGQYFGEGMDIDSLDCLFLVYPFAFEGKLIQYIGRIQRSTKPPIIFDYRDSNIDYFEKLFKQRNRYYKKLLKQYAAKKL